MAILAILNFFRPASSPAMLLVAGAECQRTQPVRHHAPPASRPIFAPQSRCRPSRSTAKGLASTTTHHGDWKHLWRRSDKRSSNIIKHHQIPSNIIKCQIAKRTFGVDGTIESDRNELRLPSSMRWPQVTNIENQMGQSTVHFKNRAVRNNTATYEGHQASKRPQIESVANLF